jgi:hypothetical protein
MVRSTGLPHNDVITAPFRAIFKSAVLQIGMTTNS